MCFAVGESSSFISLGLASLAGFALFPGELSFTLVKVVSPSLILVNDPLCFFLGVSYILLLLSKCCFYMLI